MVQPDATITYPGVNNSPAAQQMADKSSAIIHDILLNDSTAKQQSSLQYTAALHRMRTITTRYLTKPMSVTAVSMSEALVNTEDNETSHMYLYRQY